TDRRASIRIGRNMLEAHQRTRVGKREWPQEDTANDAENRRRRTDRKREGQQRDDGERRRAKQSTNAGAQVLHRVPSEREPELIAHVVSNALDAAELHERSPSCFLGRNTRSKMFLELLVDVKLDLFVEAAFDGGSRDDRANAVPTLSQLGHELLSM